MKSYTSDHNYLCSKCGEVIKAGTPFYYFDKEDGKPVRLRVHAICCIRRGDGTTRKADK